MTSIIKFQSLSGAYDESPPCYLLHIDEFTFLLDCGLDENFNTRILRELSKHVHRIDAVLISHPDCLHLGALPYLVGKLSLSCPIYATVPVYKMGQMFMYDLHQSRHNYENFTLFSLDDVDAAFDKIIQLKYNQSVVLKGKGQGITITPLPAGHMIGGTIWRILKDGEEDIIYAVDYNHKRERHLNGCMLEHISRPSLLITDAYNAIYTQARRKQRDEQLMTNILATLRGGGNVLIAVDTAGRVLELAHMLDQLWRTPDSGLMAYSLALLNTISFNVIEFAKSQVEWMSDKIMRSFEGQRNNPFQFKHLQLCHNLTELSRVREPRVVLASQPDLECGFSRELFVRWSTNPRNSIILTQRCSPDTLASEIMNGGKKMITLEIKQRAPLEGLELDEYRRQQKLKLPAKSKIDSDSDSDDAQDSEQEDIGGRSGSSSIGGYSSIKHDLMMNTEGKVKGGGFFKQAKKSYRMFPAPEQKLKWDDYGEVINPDDFMIFDHPAPATTSVLGEENKENKKEEEIPIDANEVPTKCITNVQTFNVNANIQYIDFEGRSDGESLKKIISLIKPRRLILVRGSPEATETLAAYCQSINAVLNKIFMPKLYEIVDATTESHIYQVKLKDSLVSSLTFSQAKDGAELSWINAEIDMMGEEQSLLPAKEADPKDSKDEKNDVTGSSRELLPTLKALSSDLVESHTTLFINELKLSDFKQVLMRNGIQAEFYGGVLHCNNLVAVRRNESGRIHLEGTLCDDYFKVRSLLYEQYAII